MKHCPQCGVTREYDEWDDFCPVHHTRLVARRGEEAGKADSNSTQGDRQDGNSAAGNGLMSRLKRMFSGGGKTHNTSEEAAGPKEAVLPQKLVDSGWVLTDTLPTLTTNTADFFLVTNAEGTKALFKRYRSGSDTFPSIYEAIQGLQTVRLVPVLFSGNVKVGGVEFDSELLAAAELRLFSQHLVENSVLGEAGVKWFLREVLLILNELASYGFACSHLNPRSLSVTTAGELLLNDFSQIYSAEPEDRFLPGTRNLEIEYAAPEIVNRRILAVGKSIMYSIGAIAAQMAWGFVPSQTAILHGDLDFAMLPQGVVEPLMGLLYPEPTQRWSTKELAQWLSGEEVTVPDWSRLKPGASEKAIVFHGQAIYLPENLSEILYREPDTAAGRLDEILNWLGANPRVRDVAMEIRREQASGRSGDWLILRLAFMLNRQHPRCWRGIALDDDVVAVNLAELGRQAVSGDKESMDLLNRLYDAGLNDVFIGGEQ